MGTGILPVRLWVTQKGSWGLGFGGDALRVRESGTYGGGVGETRVLRV